MNPDTIIFAIQAGIKLGRHFNQVLVQKNVERPMIFPVGDLFGSVVASDAIEYFRDEHPEFLEEGGAYHAIADDDEEKVKAYKTLLAVENRLSMTGEDAPGKDAVAMVKALHELEQQKHADGSKKALRGLMGALVEIGVDYFASQPHLMEGDASSRKILRAFVVSLDKIEFSEGVSGDILGELLLASLRTMEGELSLISDDRRVQALLGGTTKAMIEDLESAADSPGEQKRRGDFLRRMASSAFRGGADAFVGNTDLFLGADSEVKPLVDATMRQVLEGIRGHEDLFTNESLRLIVRSALEAAGGAPEVFTDEVVLQQIIRSAVTALTDRSGAALFSGETAASVLRGALEAVRDHGETLFAGGEEPDQLLATAVSALADSLASSLAGDGTVKDLLSRRQIIALAKTTLGQVAANPEILLRADEDSPGRTLLAQVVGSLAQALGESPQSLLSGEGFLDLVASATETAIRNPEALIDSGSGDPRTNLLFRILSQTVVAVNEARQEGRGSLVSRAVFLEIVEGILPLASANLTVLIEDVESEAVRETIALAFALASEPGPLRHRINGDNLPILIEGLLARVLWEELDLEDVASVNRVAEKVLREASGVA